MEIPSTKALNVSRENIDPLFMSAVRLKILKKENDIKKSQTKKDKYSSYIAYASNATHSNILM